MANLLSEHFTVYNYDRRGCGDSGDAPSYAIEREMEDLQVMIDEAGGSAVAHTLPYDAALLDGYMDGKVLPAKLWDVVTMPTLVIEGTESPVALRHAAQALVGVLPNARLLSKKGLGHTKKLDTQKISSELAAFFMGNR